MLNLFLTIALTTSKPVLPPVKHSEPVEPTLITFDVDDTEKYKKMIYYQSLKVK